jgi:hypothetical protein
MSYTVYRYKNEDSETVTVSGYNYITIKAYHGSVFDKSNGYVKVFDTRINYTIGNLHSTEAPAIEYPDGTFNWFLDGVEYTKIQWMLKIGMLL